ncbi:MAG: ROK family protein, partial [Thermomicrobiaceae bacterium]|nr:ROK family protein [Thermomicrobiaceae bacterium]
MRTTDAATSDLVPHSVTEGDRLEEVYLVPGTRAGRSVGGSSQEVYVIGVEIGGRGQRVVLANGAGEIVGQARSIDGSASAETAVETVRTLIDQATFTSGVPLSRVQRVGVAFGGPVDPARGLTLLSHRAPGFEDFPLVNILEERVGVPTVLDNDARAAALGEAMFGVARGSMNVVYVHLGTGVGAGIIVDGRLLHGTSSTAGEIGHMVVTSGG